MIFLFCSIHLFQTHYFVFNSGFQTWEYAPPYALRSYLYILIHTLPVYIYKALFYTRKVMLFYLIRCVLALFCSLCELYFYKYLFEFYTLNCIIVIYYLFLFILAGLCVRKFLLPLASTTCS